MSMSSCSSGTAGGGARMKAAGTAPITTIGAGLITTEFPDSTTVWTRVGEAITDHMPGTADHGTTNASPAAISRAVITTGTKG